MAGGRPKIPLITEDIEDLEKKLPPKPIDFEAVLHWMDLGATAEEIAGAFRVGVRTLDRRLREKTGLGFGDLKEKVCGGAKIQLRKNQFRLTKSNATMGIWLGKQWLDQRDHPQELVEFNGKLAEILTKLTAVDGEKDFKKNGADEPSAV